MKPKLTKAWWEGLRAQNLDADPPIYTIARDFPGGIEGLAASIIDKEGDPEVLWMLETRMDRALMAMVRCERVITRLEAWMSRLEKVKLP